MPDVINPNCCSRKRTKLLPMWDDYNDDDCDDDNDFEMNELLIN